MEKRLNERFLQTLKAPATGRLEIVDTEAPGLEFRVTAGGARSWSVRYRVKGGGRKRVTLGPYPGVTLAKARQRALEITAAAKGGVDLPAQEAREAEERRKAAERPQTVGHLLDRYVEEYCKANQRRWKNVERLFNNHVKPDLGDKPLLELRRADIVELLDDLQNKKGLCAQVNRVRSQLVAALNWAVDREYLNGNPAATIKRKKIEKPRGRVLSNDELRAIWKVADALPYPSGPLVKAWILTGQRRDEVRCVSWDEIDLEEGLWLLPGSRNKGKRDHLVPLSPAMRGLLEGLPRLGRYVFSVCGKKPYAGHKRLKENLDRASGVKGWVIHDIRRTVSSRMSELVSQLGMPREIVRRVLNHAKPRLDQVYDVYEYKAEKEKALNAWADRVTIIVSEGYDAANVVQLRA